VIVRTRIKVCCISSVDEAQVAVRGGADALGLVGAMPSGPGTIDLTTAAHIRRHVPPGVSTFLLSSETTAAGLIEQVHIVRPTTLQCVAEVSPGTLLAVREASPGTEIVGVVHVEDARAILRARELTEVCDALLLDSGRPNAAIPELGGTGRRHDWGLSRQIVADSTIPVWLAGGLDPDNATEAVVRVAPFGLDVCSGLRLNGTLHAGSLERFMASVRLADVGAAMASSRPVLGLPSAPTSAAADAVNVRAAGRSDRDEVLALRAAMRPETRDADNKSEVDDLLAARMKTVGVGPSAALMAWASGDVTAGFVEVSIHAWHDALNDGPVAVISGWYVTPAFRGRGVGKALMIAASRWSAGHGCHWLASDLDADNEQSVAAHEGLGFVEISRGICVARRLDGRIRLNA